jgi:nucleoside 2-deoxyribosyltransferase
MGWEEKLSQQERRDWERWVTHVRESTVRQMAGSAFVASLVPDKDETDVKFAVELGLAIMLGKPIVAIAVAGRPVPGKLREIADTVIEVSDLDTEAGQAELQAKLLPALKRLTEAET